MGSQMSNSGVRQLCRSSDSGNGMVLAVLTGWCVKGVTDRQV